MRDYNLKLEDLKDSEKLVERGKGIPKEWEEDRIREV